MGGTGGEVGEHFAAGTVEDGRTGDSDEIVDLVLGILLDDFEEATDHAFTLVTCRFFGVARYHEYREFEHFIARVIGVIREHALGFDSGSAVVSFLRVCLEGNLLKDMAQHFERGLFKRLGHRRYRRFRRG